MTIDERIDKMERQLVRIRWVSCGLIICIVLSLGIWFISKNLSGEKEIRATRFIVEDENGKARATFMMGKKRQDGSFCNPVLAMYDSNGNASILLGVNEEGWASLALLDENHIRIILKTQKEVTNMVLNDENGKGRAVLGYINGKEPSLVLAGADGMPIGSIPPIRMP